jgi:hypothetical protein
MPVPRNLEPLEVLFDGGFCPSLPALAPGGRLRTIRAGSNVWLRPDGIEVADGLLQVSATNVGARIFAADIQRAVIAGGLTGSRLPYAGLLRYQNAVLFFVSENTSAQVYLDETAVTGLTTSSTAGRLRVAIPDGVGGYDVFDAGFDKPLLVAADVVATANTGMKNMAGAIGVAISPWRSATNAWGAPSDTIYTSVVAGTNTTLAIDMPSPVSGQDGWVIAGTRWGDQSGELRIIRYVYVVPRGTFTATNGSDDITGVGTFWTRDIAIGDTYIIDGASYRILTVTSDTTATIETFVGHLPFQGVTGPGKTMTVEFVAAEWYNSELGLLVPRDVFRPPTAAGVLQYAGRVFIWGCAGESSSSPTGPSLFPMIDTNPEHIGLFAIVTASGSDLVNVLGGDGPLYLMTTTSLEMVSFTGNPATPFIIRIIAEPGFKAATNGVLYKDYFYGFTNRPLRTRADANIDVEFASDVWSVMEGWDATRVMVAVDPENEAVLFIYDDGTNTTVIPFMAQMGVWSPPLNFSNTRILDAQVVNGTLYVTVLSGGNTRVNQWEGGAGIGGSPYVASQYYDTNLLNRNRIKNALVTGKVQTLRIYAATPGAAVPDVSNSGASTANFTLSDTDITEPEIFTNIEARAAAVRCDFGTAGRLEKIVMRGTPKTERR